MKNYAITTMFILCLSGLNSYAGDGHKHEKGEKPHAEDTVAQTCEKCKKDEKDCKCDDAKVPKDAKDHKHPHSHDPKK